MSEHITHTPQVKRLERTPTEDVAGVAGGLGRYFDLNPNVFRLGLVVLTMLSGAGILVYLVAAFVMPDEGKWRSRSPSRCSPSGATGPGRSSASRLRRSPWSLLSHPPRCGPQRAPVGFSSSSPRRWASRGGEAGAGRGRILRAFIDLATIFAALATAAVVAAFSWFNISLGDGVGDRVYTPTAGASVLKPVLRARRRQPQASTCPASRPGHA